MAEVISPYLKITPAANILDMGHSPVSMSAIYKLSGYTPVWRLIESPLGPELDLPGTVTYRFDQNAPWYHPEVYHESTFGFNHARAFDATDTVDMIHHVHGLHHDFDIGWYYRMEFEMNAMRQVTGTPWFFFTFLLALMLYPFFLIRDWFMDHWSMDRNAFKWLGVIMVLTFLTAWWMNTENTRAQVRQQEVLQQISDTRSKALIESYGAAQLEHIQKLEARMNAEREASKVMQAQITDLMRQQTELMAAQAEQLSLLQAKMERMRNSRRR